MNLDQSVHLQRRIHRFAVMGILITGLLVALATAIPMYRHAHTLVSSSHMEGVRAQAQAVGQFLEKATELARQIASRSAVRDKLVEYNRWEISLAEMAQFSAPRIREALDQAGNIAGMVRFDAEGNPVLELGIALPDAAQALAGQDPIATRRTGPVATAAGPHLLVSAPILSRDGERVGTDVLAFGLSQLQAPLTRAHGSLPRTRLLVFNGESGTTVELGPSGTVVRVFDTTESAPGYLRRAVDGPAGQQHVAQNGPDEIVFYTAIREMPGWSFAYSIPATDFYRPVLWQILLPLSMIALLVSAGAVLTARTIRPMAERVLQQARDLAELGESRLLAASVFDASPQAVLIMDASHRIIEANRASVRITGYGQSKLHGKPLCEALFRPEKRASCDELLWQRVDAHNGWQGETELLRCSGEVFPAWQSVTPVRDASGVIRHYICMFTDIGEKKQAEERIRHLAHHDPLTDLPNRTLLTDRLAHGLDRARRHGNSLAVLFIDLDRFKYVNDSLGHPVGDALLRIVAERFATALREEDTLSRIGGDEFVVILEELGGADDAARVARKLLDALETPSRVDGHDLFIGASIGISLFPTDGDSIDTLVRCADSAMYRAKEVGRNTFQFFTPEQASQSRERFELERDLRQAVERGELRLVYQPQADCATGRIVGVEALVRWQHPTRGLVPPDRFIPLAEEIGLISKIGAWVLNAACAQAYQWEKQGRSLRIAVNLSGQQISRDGLVELVREVLGTTGLSSTQLELEITEGHLLQRVEQCIATLRDLKSLGVTLAIDDFGTGYSSLSYLKKLPVDRLKIDRSFVEGIPDDRDDVAIVATILSMARNLGLDVIAEGVENETQLAHLRDARCAEYQGYLLSRPVSPAELEALLDATT